MVSVAKIGHQLFRLTLVLSILGVGWLFAEGVSGQEFRDSNREMIRVVRDVGANAGLLALPVALAAFVLVKVGREKLTGWDKAALLVMAIGSALPLVMLLAYTGCPNDVC